FQTQYLLTVARDYIVKAGSEIPSLNNINITGGAPDNFFDAGSTVQLVATDGLGFTFVNWFGDATGQSNPISLPVTEQMMVTANFATPPGIDASSILNDASLQPG